MSNAILSLCTMLLYVIKFYIQGQVWFCFGQYTSKEERGVSSREFIKHTESDPVHVVENGYWQRLNNATNLPRKIRIHPQEGHHHVALWLRPPKRDIGNKDANLGGEVLEC